MMKKILIIIGSLDIGGTEKQLFLYLKKLNSYFKFEIITIVRKGVLSKDFENLGIKVTCPHNFENKKQSWYKLLKLILITKFIFFRLKYFKPEIVHFYLPQSYLIGGIISQFFKSIKKVMSRRSMNYYQKKFFLTRTIEKYLHKKMDIIFCNSIAIRDQLIEDEAVETKKIFVIRNILEKRKSLMNLTQQNNLKNDLEIKTEPIIICIANLIPYKNHMIIIDALKYIKNEKFSVIFLGKGNEVYMSKLKARILENGLKNRVKFLGSVLNPEKYLQISDLCLLMSQEEGSSNSLLNYMYYKKCSVVSPIKANKELIKHNFNGIICENFKSKVLSKNIRDLLKNKKRRNTFGFNAYKSILPFVNYDSIKKYKKIYDRL